ncbi:MAG TPA: glutamate synthase, partial [Desulfobacteraceae bacterium]|nr:glutamate synthase [Desulfobacteraceae bacterium]
MDEKASFIRYPRRDPSYRPVYERLRDYNAVELSLTFEETLIQAERCMECGTPFCHAYGCPLGNIVPEFNNAAQKANWKKALDLLLSTNNFPEFTGRICPAPCEASCVAGINSDPVNIRQIELAIIEKGFENGYIHAELPSIRFKEKVAIVG